MQESHAKLLNEAINIGDEVKVMIESPTWQNYIEPLFDALIGDVLGRKINGRWVNGALSDEELDERSIRELEKYKQGIIAVHLAIYKLIDDADAAREEIKATQQIENSELQDEYYPQGEIE